MPLLRSLAIASALNFSPVGVTADPIEDATLRYLRVLVEPLSRDPEIVAALRAANLASASLAPTEVEVLDREWRAEVGAADQPLIDSVVSRPLSARLRTWIDTTNGGAIEAFVMDARGLLVAAAEPTSDYWQGDEAVHSEAILHGAHVELPRFDASSLRYSMASGLAVFDPETGEAIGAEAPPGAIPL